MDIPVEVWGWYGDDRIAVLLRCTCRKLAEVARPKRQSNRLDGFIITDRGRFWSILYLTTGVMVIMDRGGEKLVRRPLGDLEHTAAMSAEIGCDGWGRDFVTVWTRPRADVLHAYAACTGGRNIPKIRDLVYFGANPGHSWSRPGPGGSTITIRGTMVVRGGIYPCWYLIGGALFSSQEKIALPCEYDVYMVV